MNSHPEEAVSKRSCLRCSRRKVRCDRAHPCARCIQASAESECSYPGSAKRVPRVLNRPPISVIMARLKELEGEVARLRGREECERFSDAEGKAGNWDRVGARFGNGRYVGDEASVVLGDKVCLLLLLVVCSVLMGWCRYASCEKPTTWKRRGLDLSQWLIVMVTIYRSYYSLNGSRCSGLSTGKTLHP